MRLLKDVKIGKLVQDINENAFKDQIKLETVFLNSNYIIKMPHLKNKFGNQVKYCIIEDDVNSSIGQKAFYNCSNLESLIIGKNVPGIGEQALRGCASLSNIEIPKNIKNIEAHAFADCGSDSKPLNIIFESDDPINLVDSSDNIIYAFGEINSDDNLPIKIYVPVNFEEIYAEKDAGWNYYSQFINNLNLNIFYYNDETIRRTYDTTISSDSVGDKSKLIKVQIGIKVTNIENGAFANCNNLTSVVWNAKNCNVSGQFGQQVESFIFGSEVENIPARCCKNMNNLTSIEIPNSVAYIGNEAFMQCSRLTGVSIGNSVSIINENAFNGCSNLPSVVIPDSITAIRQYAFSGCNSLTSITIPNSVTSIESNAFSNCRELAKVTIESDDIVSKTYDQYANIKNIFGDQVKDYIIGNSVTSIGNYAFNQCHSLTSVSIGNSITDIGERAFQQCDGLNSATIPNSVTDIRYRAFYRCNELLTVSIGNSITNIGEEAFRRCESLTSITCEATEPPTLENAVFYDTNACPIYVPPGSLYAYKSKWSVYASRIYEITEQ